MEHLIHIFGGGCGEHLVWPWLASGGSGLLLMLRTWVKPKDIECPK